MFDNGIDHENKFYTNVQTATKISVFEYDGNTPGVYENLQHPIPTQYRFLNIWNYSVFRVSIYDREGHQLAEVAPKSQNYFNAYIGSPSSDLYFRIIWESDYMAELYAKYNVTGTAFRVVASDVPLLEPLSLMSDLMAVKNTENLEQLVDNGININNPDDLKENTALQPNYFSQTYNTLIGIIDPANPTGEAYTEALPMDYEPSNPIFSGAFTTNDFYIGSDTMLAGDNPLNIHYNYEWFNSYNIANFLLNYFNNLVTSSAASVTDLETLMIVITQLQSMLSVNINIQGLNLYYKPASYCQNQLAGANYVLYDDTTTTGYGAQFVGDFNIAGMATPINDGYDDNMMQVYCNPDAVTNFTPYLNTVKMRNINGITAPTFMTMCASVGLPIDPENLTATTKPGIFQISLPFNTTPKNETQNLYIIQALLECYALNDIDSAKTVLQAGLIGNDALYFYDYCNKICFEYMAGLIHEQLRYPGTRQEFIMQTDYINLAVSSATTCLFTYTDLIIFNGIISVYYENQHHLYSLTTNKKVNKVGFSQPMIKMKNLSAGTNNTDRSYSDYLNLTYYFNTNINPEFQFTFSNITYDKGYNNLNAAQATPFFLTTSPDNCIDIARLNRRYLNALILYNIGFSQQATVDAAITFMYKLDGADVNINGN